MKIQRFMPPQQQTTQKELDNRMKDAAKMYEKMFLREMVKAMRNTVKPGSLTKPSMAENIFKEKLDSQYIESWGDNGGVGLANVIYDQLKERFGNSKGPMMLRPQGPLPIKKGTTIKVDDSKKQVIPTQSLLNQPKDIQSFIIDMNEAAGKEDAVVTMPWDGKIKNIVKNEQGQNLIKIDHENGLTSTLGFSGSVESIKSGDEMLAGLKLGQVYGADLALTWDVEPGV